MKGILLPPPNRFELISTDFRENPSKFHVQSEPRWFMRTHRYYGRTWRQQTLSVTMRTQAARRKLCSSVKWLQTPVSFQHILFWTGPAWHTAPSIEQFICTIKKKNKNESLPVPVFILARKFRGGIAQCIKNSRPHTCRIPDENSENQQFVSLPLYCLFVHRMSW